MIEEIGEQIKYRYLWKTLEIITFLVVARILGPETFGVSFLIITAAYISMDILKATCKEDTAAYKKKFYNTFLFINIIYGIIVSLVFFVVSYLFTSEMCLAAKLGSAILLLSTISTVPDHYFSWKNSMTRLYKPYFKAQVITSIVAIAYSLYRPSVYSVLVPYTIYYIVKAVLLWKRFPFKVRPTPNKEMLKESLKELYLRLPNILMQILLNYGALIIVAFFFGVSSFAKLFIGLSIAYFFYENLTIYLNSVLLPKFMNLNFEMLKIDIIRYAEYMAFLMIPFITSILILSKEFTNYVLGPQWFFSGILPILLITGLLKGIFDITRIVFIWFKKAEIIQRIQLIELVVFLTLSVILYKIQIFSVIVALFISTITASVLSILITIRLLKVDVLTMFKDYFYLFFSGLATLFTVGLLKEIMPVKNWIYLAIYFILGIALYVLIAYFLNREILQRSMRFMIKLFDEE